MGLLAKMLKLVVLFALFLSGTSGRYLRNDDYDLTSDDVRNIINLVFCACDQGNHDGDLTLEEWMGPVCENVNDHLFGYQVSEDDFNNADANGDGKCTVDEVHDFAMSQAAGRSLNREFYFSNDASVEARVRIIGCAWEKRNLNGLMPTTTASLMVKKPPLLWKWLKKIM